MADEELLDAAGLVAMARLAGLRLDDTRAEALLPMVRGLALAGQRLSELAMQEAPASPAEPAP